ncbi:N-terminal kinase-like protein [Tolypocladium paradoxum]|uniref:N-terminal kinase-like protein n=1 Tax=Tolypocladium paradoxum TaxID=94208 RepID=A0A2S4KNR6_9HYPO|nr:N-terminal kinase-like protein [Tolypocladium paradoxum]
MDFLKSAVASAMAQGPPFPYSFGDKVDVDESIWSLYNGTRRASRSLRNCLHLPSTDPLALGRRLKLQHLLLRHTRQQGPTAPSKERAQEIADDAPPGRRKSAGYRRGMLHDHTDTYIYIATERVVPLRWHVRRKSLSPETIKWGLHNVARTTKFINSDASSIHGSLKVGSVYTSESGEWKLGGFDVLSSVKDDESVIYTYGSLVPDSARYAPPELARGGWDIVKKNPHSAVDSFNFGTLIFEVFNGDYSGSDQAGQTKNVPPTMQSSYKRLCNANPKARISVANFLDQGSRTGAFFDSPLIKLTEGIDNLGVKTPGEREAFLNDLDQLTDDFPEEFFKLKVLPELIKSVEFGGGGPKALAVVLKIAAKLSDEDFDAKITPFVVRVFANPDRAIRVCLLDSLPLMIERLQQKTVNDKIFPQIATGFMDMQPVVREQTLKSVLILISKLSDRTINNELLKHLAKTANDEQPGIRTNTTICLGKIARYLGTSSRSKVLIAAFTRSLRDPFVHARNAALLALGATAEYFSDDDSAGRILPAICPLLVDKEKLVRDQASRTMDVYVQRVRKAASEMPDTVLPPPQAAGEAQPARMGTPQTGGSSGWTGWAISSFTNKISAVAGDMQTANGSSTAAVRPSPSPGPELKKQATASATSLHRQVVKSPPPNASGTSSPTASAVAEAFLSEDVADDGGASWGDMGDMGDDDGVVDTPSATTTTKAPVAAASTTPFGDDEPDFASWLAAQAQKKKPGAKPLPKGLAKSSTAKKPITKPLAKPVVAKKIDMKPKETEDDDGWGDGW